MDKIIKYSNIIILLGSVVTLGWGAISWVPNTFLTITSAKGLISDLDDASLARDKELHRLARWNYLETQIRLNFLILRNYEQKEKEGSLTIEEQIAFGALKQGQADLIGQRNELAQANPTWSQ